VTFAPKVSVLIHFLNAEKYLRDAVRSVLWQTFTDWELILIDGGSTDESPSIASEFVRQTPTRR